jgi:hypothetical protein
LGWHIRVGREEETVSRYWIGWDEPTPDGDYRPLRLPVPPEIKAWWCSGSGDDVSMLCAVVDAPDEAAAKAAVEAEWRPSRWRFCNVKPPDWRPSDRFPWPEEE